MTATNEECTTPSDLYEGEAQSTSMPTLFELDTVPWPGIFASSLLEEQLGLKWHDEPSNQSDETMLILNLGRGGETGVIVSLLARRDFGLGRVIVAVPSTNGSTARSVQTARAMGATDVIVVQQNGSDKSLKTQLDKLGVTEVTYVVVCHSRYEYTGPYVSGASPELGASDQSCELLPTLDQLDEFLHRSTSVWNSMVDGEMVADNFDENNTRDKLLWQLAKQYPDDDHWPRLVGLAPEKLELKGVVLAQKSGIEHAQMQVVVGSKND